MKTLIDYWRHFRTVRNTKCVFITLYEGGNEIPDDLMQEVISVMKKEVDYENQDIIGHESKAWRVVKAVEEREKGVSKTKIFENLAEEFGGEEYVKRIYYKHRKPDD